MPLLLEYWKPVVGFEESYIVSITGRVQNVRTGEILKHYPSRRYPAVTLRRNRNRFHMRVHVLVSNAFLGTLPAGMERNHIDGWKINNRASNLEFLTHAKNMEHSFRLGLRKTVTPRKLTESQVAEIRAKYIRGKARELGKLYGVSKDCINDLIRGKTWSQR